VSKAQKIAKLKEIIRELIKNNLEEVSTTASAGAASPSGTGIYYDTPLAFSGKSKKSKKKKKKITHAAGMKPVKESVINEYVSVDNFNKDFNMAMDLVIKQANNLKGPLGKHPIKRNVNKLKAVQNLFKKFVAPALVKADRDISKGFDLTRIKKDLADGKFKSVLEYQIMNRIGGRGYDSNEFFGIDDKVKKLLDRIFGELRKLVNIMDKAQLESVNEASTLTLRGKNGKMVDVPRKFASIISGIDRGMSKFNPRGVMFGHRKYHKLKPNDEFSGSIVLKNPLSKKDIDDVMKQLKRTGSSLGIKFEKITFNPDRNEPFIEFRVKPEQFNESVNEVTDKEINAMKKVLKDMENLRKSFTKATTIGDKELKRKWYNQHYEKIITAHKGIIVMLHNMRNKQLMGEGILNELTDSQWRDANSSFVGNKYFPTMLKAAKKIIQDKDEKKLEEFIGANYRYFKNMSKNFKFRLKEGRYHDWRNDESMTPKQKIGISVREVRDALTELDKRIKMNLQLKTELNMDGSAYWKNTHKALTKISERLVKLAGKVGNLK